VQLASRSTKDFINFVATVHRQSGIRVMMDIRHNGAIHRALLELSQNEVLIEVWEMLHPRVEQARTLANLYPDRWHAAVLEHEAMLKALAARDEAVLAALMQSHYANGLAKLISEREAGNGQPTERIDRKHRQG